MKYKVIDNFLDEEYFDSLVTLFTDKKKERERIGVMPWFFQSEISAENVAEDKLFYMYHMFYEHNAPTSHHYEKLIPLSSIVHHRCNIPINPSSSSLASNP